ncbi:MAG: terminase small subunit [Verrucomicrobiae bacterium]|nr:terminase small subunit [Verrucomicrobiae bacterium]
MSNRKIKQCPPWWGHFITEYLRNGQNAKRAYLKAKPKVTERTAEVESAKLLSKPDFLEQLKAAQENVAKRVGMTRDRWLQLLADVAEFDLREFLEIDPVTGDTRLVKDWKERAKGHAIESLKIRTTTLESGQVVQTVATTRDSKLKALELIGKSLQYLVEKVDVNHTFDLADAIIKARRRASGGSNGKS